MRDTTARKVYRIFALSFIFTLSLALPAYINSSFLGEFISERLIGLVFVVAALMAIVLLAGIPKALRMFGSFDTTFTLMVLGSALLFGLAVFRSPIVVIILFLVYEATYSLLAFEMDLLLERYSLDRQTGRIRGAYLSISNVAWILAPVTAGFILGENHYSRVFAVAALLMLILTLVFVRGFERYRDLRYRDLPFWRTVRHVYQRKNLLRIFITQLFLQSFFAWMIVYTPLYLHEHIGLQWHTLGVVFTVMLIPYVLLEYPLGKIADTRFGEKEIMSLGFIIMGLGAGVLSFITSTSALVWVIALFVTRIGAATVESMSESYFFKQIDGTDSHTISLFRMMGPLSYVVSPLLATVALLVVDFKYIFLVLGVLMLTGLFASTKLRDSR